jgi:tRNA pseudouridine38-40 synthase
VVLRIAPPRLTVAGRTDAGVHARGQVCHADVPNAGWLAVPGRSTRSPDDAIVHRLAGVLPADIRVTLVGVAPDGFDARFSAIWRRYAYRVADTPYGVDPLRRWWVLWHPRSLDLSAMNAAAENLLGEHDFAAFCRARQGASTIRELRALRWQRAEDGVAVATVEADAFCHNQVRALVGALLAVGDGRRAVAWPGQVLDGRRRDPGVSVVPSRGLTLEGVGYPPDSDLRDRAVVSRRRRGPSGTP